MNAREVIEQAVQEKKSLIRIERNYNKGEWSWI